MKVSVNWLQEYLDFELPPINELVERIGSQLGAVEEVTDLGAKYQGAVIVRVVECAPLEGSDHLNLCFIDDKAAVPGINRRDDGLVQVVCGAPNVAAGQNVVWLPPGATVPSTYATEPFVLEARELRGTVSNGMLASPKELALGDSHEGLLILDSDAPVGDDFAKPYGLDDHIIDIENKMFTHRPDCFGLLGVAREVAGIFGQPFTSPSDFALTSSLADGSGLPLTVRNEAPNDVPRFMAVALNNVTIQPSPTWLQVVLSRVGVRPINNVVDVTNYIMLLTGQPTHAYDYDKVAALSDGEGATIVARYPSQDEQLQLLSGKTITPRDQAVIIATNTQAIGLGGVMGGAKAEVDDSTKNIIVECANFDMYSIRRTSMAHGLFTDAVTRFNKGQSPLQNPTVLAQTVTHLQTLSGAQLASPVIDLHKGLPGAGSVNLDISFINARLGLSLTPDTVAKLLQNVEFNVDIAGDSLTVGVPFWRTDIQLPEDVVEEVGRLYGFDKLPLELPVRSIVPAVQDELLELKAITRASLAKAGANELLTYSFVHGKLLDAVGQNKDQAFSLSNALSPELQYLRLSPLPSLLDKVHANIKAGHDEFALFELGKGHSLEFADSDNGLPLEFEDLDLVYASKTAGQGAAFYKARRLLDAMAADLGLSLCYIAPTSDLHDPVTEPFDLQRSAQVFAGDTMLGIVGEFKASVRRNLKLPDYCAGFSISLRQLLKVNAKQKADYQPLPRYPKIEQDVCLRVPAAVSFVQLEQLVTNTLAAAKSEHARVQVVPLDIYKREAGDEFKQITFRVAVASFEKTMTDAEMSLLLEQVTQKAAESFGAERV